MKATKENENNPLTKSISPELDIDVIDEIEKRQELESLPSSFFPTLILPEIDDFDDIDNVENIENSLELTPHEE